MILISISPWWFVYQPVSYRLISRQGTLQQLRSMISVCRTNGVRVYADAVVNHMVSPLFQRRFLFLSSSIHCSLVVATIFKITEAAGAHRRVGGTVQRMPQLAAPTSLPHRHISTICKLSNVLPWSSQRYPTNPLTSTATDPSIPSLPDLSSTTVCLLGSSPVEFILSLDSLGWLVGLTDLNTEKPYVQERIATYFATLLSIGEFEYGHASYIIRVLTI